MLDPWCNSINLIILIGRGACKQNGEGCISWGNGDPFNLYAEHDRFRVLCSWLNQIWNTYLLILQKLICWICIRRMRTIFVKNYWKSPSRMCPILYLWIFITVDGYICLMAHFTNGEWISQKLVLNFSYMSPPHLGVATEKKMSFLLNEWGIVTKIFSMILDNALTNDVFAQVMNNLHLKKKCNE